MLSRNVSLLAERPSRFAVQYRINEDFQPDLLYPNTALYQQYKQRVAVSLTSAPYQQLDPLLRPLLLDVTFRCDNQTLSRGVSCRRSQLDVYRAPNYSFVACFVLDCTGKNNYVRL